MSEDGEWGRGRECPSLGPYHFASAVICLLVSLCVVMDSRRAHRDQASSALCRPDLQLEGSVVIDFFRGPQARLVLCDRMVFSTAAPDARKL